MILGILAILCKLKWVPFAEWPVWEPCISLSGAERATERLADGRTDGRTGGDGAAAAAQRLAFRAAGRPAGHRASIGGVIGKSGGCPLSSTSHVNNSARISLIPVKLLG